MKRRQRAIRPDQWTDPGLLAVPAPTRLTGMGLWGVVDDEGRTELRSNLLAGAIYPGDPTMTPELIETHLLQLDESGFLTIYPAGGGTWVQLSRPLLTQRPRPSECPPPPVPEHSGNFLAVGGARERAGARVRAEQAERAGQWATWADEQEQAPRPPARPLLLDAPPIGCPDHSHGRFANCGPCGTARKRHDRWVQEARYGEQMTEFEKTQGNDENSGEGWSDEPF